MTERIEIPVAAVHLPAYAHDGDAGADLSAAETVTLAPGERYTVSTGTAMAVPQGYAAFIVPRSGLAARHGITIVNSPGTVDSGYRGEIRVTLLNTDLEHPYTVTVGDRIAQVIVAPVTPVTFIRTTELPAGSRGAEGFGSSGYTVSDMGEHA